MSVASGGLAVVATLSTGGVAQAANTYTVTNLADSGPGSLRAAAAAVTADSTDTTAPGDSIVFASGLSGTLSLTSDEIYIKHPVQLIGPGADKLTIHGAAGHRVLDLHYAPAKISGLTITGGAAGSGNGGGIFSYNGDVELDGVTVKGNSAAVGGGVSTKTSANLTLNNSTISGNTASVKGGGIYEYDFLTATDSTISGNTSPKGAGAYLYDDTTLTGTTIAGNTPSATGGQIGMEGSGYTLTLQDSIVAGSGSVPDIALPSGNTTTASFSLIRNTSVPTGDAPVTTDATDKTGVDPKLAALAFNGGPTPTMAPLPTSPVLDQGKSFSLTTDQRGLSRPFTLPGLTAPTGGDHSDIGAVEIHTPAISGLSPTSGGAGTHVAIVGTGFNGATKVMFGSTPATSFTVLSDGVISAVAPPYNGPADVRVIGPFGETPIVAADRFIFPTFTPTAKPKHAKGKLKGHTLTTNEKVSCPTGGPSCTFSFSMREHKLKLGKGKFTLNAGASKRIKLKLKNTTLRKLRHHKHVKLKLVITAIDGTGAPVTITRTVKL